EIFVGMGDGSAALDEDMTRAQAAVIVSKLFGLNIDNVPANASFTDVPTKHWAYASVEAAQAAGIISGRGDGTFDPNGLVTKQELAIMFGIAYENILGVTIPNGTVNGEFKNWPGTEKYIAFAVNNGILENTSDFTAIASRAVLAYAAYQGHTDTTVAEEVGIANVSASGVNKV